MASLYEQEPGGAPEGLMLSTTQPHPLLSLPTELILSIFRRLSPDDIFHFELVCRNFREKVAKVDAYYEWYGSAIPHQRVHAKTNWRLMAFHMNLYFNDLRTPKEAAHRLFHEDYLYDRMTLAKKSELVITSLRRSQERTPEWFAVMAAACMAQGRRGEAEELYSTIVKRTGALPASAFLTSARFGWPDTFPSLSNSTQAKKMKEKALFGATAAGNLDMVKQLHSEGVPLEQRHGRYNLATLAAELGHLPLLQYLYEQGNDVVGTLPGGRSALMEATRFDQNEIVRWLLDFGANPFQGYDRPFDRALRQGNTEVVKMFVQRAPYPLSPDKPDGRLLIEDVLGSNFNPGKRDELIKCLVVEGGLDVDARNRSGENAVHVAAQWGDLQSLRLLWTLGANISMKDDLERTPLDIAIQSGQVYLTSWLFQNTTGESQLITASERALAMNRITYQRGWLIQRATSASLEMDPTFLEAYFTRGFYDGKAMMRMLAESEILLGGDRAREALVTGSTEEGSDWEFFAPRCPRRRQHFMKFMESIGIVWRTCFDELKDSFGVIWEDSHQAIANPYEGANEERVLRIRKDHLSMAISHGSGLKKEVYDHISKALLEIQDDATLITLRTCKDGGITTDRGPALLRPNEGVLRGLGLIDGVRQHVTMICRNGTSVDGPVERPFHRSTQASECFIGGFGVAYLHGRLNTAGSIRKWLHYIRRDESFAFAELQSFCQGCHRIVCGKRSHRLAPSDTDTLIEIPNNIGWPNSHWETGRDVSSFWRWAGLSETPRSALSLTQHYALREYSSFRTELFAGDIDHLYLNLHGQIL